MRVGMGMSMEMKEVMRETIKQRNNAEKKK